MFLLVNRKHTEAIHCVQGTSWVPGALGLEKDSCVTSIAALVFLNGHGIKLLSRSFLLADRLLEHLSALFRELPLCGEQWLAQKPNTGQSTESMPSGGVHP